MPRDIVKYGMNAHGFFTEWGDVQRVPRERAKLYDLIDQLDDFYGHAIYEKKVEMDPDGRAVVTIQFDGDAWIDRDDRADRLERMLRWLVLKLSAEELRYLGIVPRTADPAAFTVEQLIEGLREQFDAFAAADDRLRGKHRR